MTKLENLRNFARSLFQSGLEAADPRTALTKALQAHPDLSQYHKDGSSSEQSIIILAIGKAALPMAMTMLENLPPKAVKSCHIVTNYENAEQAPPLPAYCTLHPSGHPVPDQNGERAAQAILDCLAHSTEQDHIITLISGGGSALLPCPIDGISLDDKIAVNKVLLANGLPIHEMNLIRQTLSKLKGGGLASLAAPSRITSFILSDVVGDDLATIASGPTVAPLGTRQEALALFNKYDLLTQLPLSVRDYLNDADDTPTHRNPNCENILIGTNGKSLEAIQSSTKTTLPDWTTTILSNRLEGDVNDVAQQLHAIAQQAPEGEKSIYLWGGETTVTLTGNGKGGRNQELALRFVALADQSPIKGQWAFLSGGTDGRDGPTDSAGGLVDAETISRIKAASGDIASLLANNDSYQALALADDHVITGPTGTNVADIQIFLCDKTNKTG